MILVEERLLYSIMFSAEIPGYFWAMEYNVSPFFTVYFVYSAEDADADGAADDEDLDAVDGAAEVLEAALGAEPLL